MSEVARAWIAEHHGNAAVDRVSSFLSLVIAENDRQNLIAPSTIETIWDRHALDSAQLLAFDRPDATWLDIGSGGGFPGMVAALLRAAPVILVEPRARRAAFLRDAAAALGCEHVTVMATKVERVSLSPVGLVSARAVATIGTLIDGARNCTNEDTRWILPRGRSGAEDLEALHYTWQGMFHVEQSVVDTTSTILILDKVSRR